MRKICLNCIKRFNPSSRHKLCPSCRNIFYKKLCPKCGIRIQKKSNLCNKCSSAARRKDNAVVIDTKGYVYIRKREHPRAQKGTGYIFEHILIMEKKLGRYLFPNENIHHINGVRNDNRIENLELWTKPQPTGIRTKDAVIWAKSILEIYGNDETKY